MLDDSVFAGVVRDDGEHSARNEPVAKKWERFLERWQLVVYANAQGLEKPGEIRRAASGAEPMYGRSGQYSSAFGLTLNYVESSGSRPCCSSPSLIVRVRFR